MADKSVGELIAAQSVTPTDLFVLEQNGTAKKLTGQILENWLVSFADGHGGIQSIKKLSTSGLADTYRITLSDTTTFDFVVNNGRGITGISKTSTSSLVDTYTISYNNGTTSKFTVTNGAKGDKGDNAYLWVKYASQQPTASSHSFGDVPDAWIGIYAGTSATAPTDWQQYKWYKIKGEQGDIGSPATLTSSQVTYQVGSSGTVIPSGNWSTSIPVVTPGQYLWTRNVIQFNTGNAITSYSVSRFGIDGSGAVSSVAGISPDENGNVPLTADNLGALSKKGGTMEGSINMNGQKLSGLNAPTADDEATNKGYVDTALKKVDVSDKVDKSSVVNNFTTTEEGFVADARALKILYDVKLSMELLWENASPNSEFSEQTVSLDWNGCKYFLVEYLLYIGANIYLTSGPIKVGASTRMNFVSDGTDGASGNYRDFNSNTKKMGLCTRLSDGKTNDQKGCIPVKIYGVKGVPV